MHAMPMPGRGRTYIPREVFGKTAVDSLRAVWALVCRVSGTGNLEAEETSVRSGLNGDDEGWHFIDWNQSEAEEDVDLPQ
jgi:hypothetical protein